MNDLIIQDKSVVRDEALSRLSKVLRIVHVHVCVYMFDIVGSRLIISLERVNLASKGIAVGFCKYMYVLCERFNTRNSIKNYSFFV